MPLIEWDPIAREFLRKLPKDVAKRIFKKVDEEVVKDIPRYLETLVGIEGYKIRIGHFRLFVDYYPKDGRLIVRSVRHRKNAYKF